MASAARLEINGAGTGTGSRDTKHATGMRRQGAVVPDGTMIGVDPVQDRERFYVSENGVTLVTASMLRAPARSGGG